MEHRWLSEDEVITALKAVGLRLRHLAVFSTYLGGFSQASWAALLPLEDHMVHRGDGVFEAVRVIQGRVFDLDAHLARLQRSAEAIGLKLPMSLSEISDVAGELIRNQSEHDSLIRIFVSRGIGGYSTNPYECPSSHLHVVLLPYRSPSTELYIKGARAGFSSVPPKDGYFATLKTCNYLPNVLMKKESVDRSLDFTLGLNAHGEVLEGSTENFMMVDQDGVLRVPPFSETLRGTTALQVLQLARNLDHTHVTDIREGVVSRHEVLSAREMFFVGTTIEVMPVTQFEGLPVGGHGQVGPVARALRSALHTVMGLSQG